VATAWSEQRLRAMRAARCREFACSASSAAIAAVRAENVPEELQAEVIAMLQARQR
jgi:hypothetical protein